MKIVHLDSIIQKLTQDKTIWVVVCEKEAILWIDLDTASKYMLNDEDTHFIQYINGKWWKKEVEDKNGEGEWFEIAKEGDAIIYRKIYDCTNV